MNIVLVCGGRNFCDSRLLFEEINSLHKKTPFTVLIEGDAYGADKMSEVWATINDVPVVKYPAKWWLHGNSAGYKRNMEMLRDGKPNLVVAFPGGKGTQMMMRLARDRGIEVIECQ